VVVLVEQGEDVRADGDVVAAGTAITHEGAARDVTHFGEHCSRDVMVRKEMVSGAGRKPNHGDGDAESAEEQ
jgi:hypothetical protein